MTNKKRNICIFCQILSEIFLWENIENTNYKIRTLYIFVPYNFSQITRKIYQNRCKSLPFGKHRRLFFLYKLLLHLNSIIKNILQYNDSPTLCLLSVLRGNPIHPQHLPPDIVEHGSSYHHKGQEISQNSRRVTTNRMATLLVLLVCHSFEEWTKGDN